MEQSYRDLLLHIGEDIEREGLVKTPERAARALEFMTQGYRQDLDTVINGAIFSSDNDEMVIVKDIEFYSLCEHHMLPFHGRCHIGYLPQGRILGLSKLARIVDYFSRRLQVQENLTKEIADCVMEITQALGVGVIIEARHFCMLMRGVQKQSATMSTSMMLGEFRTNPKTRSEFISLTQ